ncbi:MAG: beta-N-acetylhexosaminidase [Desulfobacteraceae bacterium]
MNTTLELSELDRMVGQLFMCGLPGKTLDRETRTLIRQVHPGGIILFSRNIEDPVQLSTLCRELQEAALEAHGNPLFLSVDQEGGRVARLKSPFTEFPGNEAIGNDGNPRHRAEEFARITAREMKLVGLNMNLAPVLDVPCGDPEEHLRGRTFGEDPQVVAELGRTVIQTFQAEGVMAVAKHFPGLGRTSKDPHLHLPKIVLDRDELDSKSLMPFRIAIEEGVSGVMTSHAIYTALDAENPATLSRIVINDLLRQDMGFDGLVLTDDLEMGAIAGGRGVARGAAEAFEAGADLLLICEDQHLVREGLATIRSKLLRQGIPMERLHQALARIQSARSRFLKPWHRHSTAEVEAFFHSARG